MQVLHQIPKLYDPNVIIGYETSDDAAVYKLSDDLAVVQTVDYFTPIVDDPYTFGCISAANALSDIYAMGAKPIMGLNIAGFPVNKLSLDVLVQILQGGSDKAKEAGITIAGGHTIDDNEPKYGMVVTGLVHPEKIITNSNAKPGDVLILTKPIGVGIITTAMKEDIAPIESAEMAIKAMSALNKSSAEAMIKVGVNACTDVTGFGLLGHLYEMVSGSSVGAVISLEKVPIIDGTWKLADDLIIPAGTMRNHEYLVEHIIWDDISYEHQMILCDAQTSGGLLISVPEEKSGDLVRLLQESNALASAIIGRITDNDIGIIKVKKLGMVHN
jgi:selenide,water dikinase